jgi:small subunit ribosomal protein S9
VDNSQVQATGRRKRAIARVKLVLGQGVITVNKKPLEEYFPRPQLQQIVRQPFEATQSGARYDVIVKAQGGGVTGQAGAVRHGIARALVEMDPSFKDAMRKNGFLTRDPREKESKKYGRKRARKRFQFSKR